MKHAHLSIVLLFAVLLSVNFVSAQEGGCPGKQFPKIEINYSFSQQINGIELDVGYDCAPGSQLHFEIRNYKNDDIIVYTDGNGNQHEILPYQSTQTIAFNESLPYCSQGGGECSHSMTCASANGTIINGHTCIDNQVCCKFKSVEEANQWYLKSWFKDETIPQEDSAKWTRMLYFKSKPNEKITLSAENVLIGGNAPSARSYTIYYMAGAIILIVIILVLVLGRKKN